MSNYLSRELNRNINAITKTNDEKTQNKLAKKTNQLLEEIIEIEDENRLERVNSFTLLGLEPKLLCEVRTPMKAA